MGGIGSKYFHEQTTALNFFGCLLDPFFIDVPLDVDEENIFPGLAAGGTGFDLGHVETMGGKGSQEIVQRANLILDRQHERGLVTTSPFRRFLRQYEKAGKVIDVV